MIKQRNIALCIVFSIITFGIYALYWFVCLTNDANQESGQTDATSGGVALLLTIVTCNIYIVKNDYVFVRYGNRKLSRFDNILIFICIAGAVMFAVLRNVMRF